MSSGFRGGELPRRQPRSWRRAELESAAPLWAVGTTAEPGRIRVGPLLASAGAGRPPTRRTVGEEAESERSRLIPLPTGAGTAAGVLFAAHWILWRDPQGIVAFSPAEHPPEENPHVSAAADIVRTRPRWLALLSYRPVGPETERGFIEPGEPLAGQAVDAWRVRRLHALPGTQASRERSSLWDASVVVGRASTIVAHGRRRLPALSRGLQRIAPFGGPIEESWALRRALGESPPLDFFRDLLPDFLPHVAVLRQDAAPSG